MKWGGRNRSAAGIYVFTTQGTISGLDLGPGKKTLNLL